MNCTNCGHGRHQHKHAARLSGWERSRGRTRPRPGAWLPCQATVLVEREPYSITMPDGREATVTPGPINAKCACRKYKEPS